DGSATSQAPDPLSVSNQCSNDNGEIGCTVEANPTQGAGIDSTRSLLKALQNLQASRLGRAGHGTRREGGLDGIDHVMFGRELGFDGRNKLMNGLIALDLHQGGNRHAPKGCNAA